MRVVNKRTHTPTSHDVPIGRPSIFGNPYSHKPSAFPEVIILPSRDDAIAAYESWIMLELCAGNTELDAALRALTEESVLVCWCVPARCHGEVVRAVWELLYK